MMENKYLFGSKMLKLSRCRDEDWLTFTEGKASQPGMRRVGFQKFVIKTFVEGKNVVTDVNKAWFLYQFSREFHNDENYPSNDFNILEHKKVWIDHLKNYMNLESTEQSVVDREILPKQFYHILYQYYMITEDTHWISEVAKAEVQKIHDLEMPSSYFYELRDLINSL